MKRLLSPTCPCNSAGQGTKESSRLAHGAPKLGGLQTSQHLQGTAGPGPLIFLDAPGLPGSVLSEIRQNPCRAGALGQQARALLCPWIWPIWPIVPIWLVCV